MLGISNTEVKNILGEEVYSLFTYGEIQQALRSNLSACSGEIAVRNNGFQYTTSYYDVVSGDDELVVTSVGESGEEAPHNFLSLREEIILVTKHIVTKIISHLLKGGKLENNFGDVGDITELEAMHRLSRLQLLIEQL